MKDSIALAGLLHDIGKFYQRADRYDKGWTLLNDEYKNLESEFCPSYKNKYTHKHVLWTAQFIEKILNYKQQSNQKDTVLQLASRHHKPQTFLEHIITLADHLSSGMDRNKLTADALKEEEDFGYYKSTSLLSIFETIHREDKAGMRWKYRQPVGQLDTLDIMPVHREDIPDVENLYEKAWKAFENEIKGMAQNKIKATTPHINTLYFLMQKYLSNVPSSTMDLPDVSLFDHSVTVAGFATCLYEYAEENNITDIKELREDTTPFILLGADLSGIQNYIFNIVSKNAAKNIKGRSFYLHIITTTVLHKILDDLGYSRTQIIYNSGGSFYLLLPNTKRTTVYLEELERDLEKAFFHTFGGKLYLALGHSTFGCQPVFDKAINTYWQNTLEQVQAKKRKRFAKLMLTDYECFFKPNGKGDLADTDPVTGDELLENAKNLSGVGRVNLHTWQQVELGKKLKQTNYWTIKKEQQNETEFCINFLGYSHFFTKEIDDKTNPEEHRTVYCINQVDNFLPKRLHKNTSYGFDFYGGNDYPVESTGEPKTFDRLAKGNYNKLSVIRMDVDNLGYVFANGFDEKNKTFSRYASLSRKLDLFFKGYINTIWQGNEDYKNYTLVVYSGGDDLFILGDWQIAINFAEDIRSAFRQYVCFNPIFTLSGGTAIIPPKLPIIKAAGFAEDAEKTGKNYTDSSSTTRVKVKQSQGIAYKDMTKQKDAFGLMDHALGWDKEYPVVKEIARTFVNRIQSSEKDAYPRALLHLLMKHHENANIINNKITHSRTIWLMNYDFSRRISELKSESAKKEIDMIRRDVLENKYQNKTHNYTIHSFSLYALAARWAELILRDE